MRCPSRSPEETRAIAAALGTVLREAIEEGAVVGLVGALGAGKTEFVRGLAEGAGADPGLVASPSFVVASEYPSRDGTLRVAHVDCYRLESEAELEAAGFLDWLVPGVIVAVEWADRFPPALPADHLDVRIERNPGGDARSRELVARARGPRAEAWCREWAVRLASAGAAP